MADGRMSEPIRLRLSRAKGYSLQRASIKANGLPAVNVARPGRFGNPFTMAGCREAGFIGDDAAIAARCVEAFRVWLDTPHWRENWDGEDSEFSRASMIAGLPGLQGQNLACWCGEGPCHADVLLAIANRMVCEAAP